MDMNDHSHFWFPALHVSDDPDSIPLLSTALTRSSIACFLFQPDQKLFWYNESAASILQGAQDNSYPSLNGLFTQAGFHLSANLDEAVNEAILNQTNQSFFAEQDRLSETRFFLIEILGGALPSNWVLVQLIDRSDDAVKLHDELLKRTKAEENDRLKTLFLANISHEIRTPLNSIIGFSELILDQDDVAEEHQEYARMIQAAGDTLLQLINDIIDISKIEAGQIKITKLVVDVDQALDEILLMVQNQLRSKGKEHIRVYIEKPVYVSPFRIETDPNRFRQIFINLLTNAIKFIENGSIRFGYTEVDGDFVQFYVKDTGLGIERDKAPQIFQRFAKFDSPYGHNREGTGLGLSITQQLVELMGGKIWFDTEYQKGSTFYFTLPTMPDQQKKPLPKTFLSSAKSWEGHVFLVVDDVEANYIFFKSAFKLTGAEILWASNGDEALRLCRENPSISLVLVDIMMPLMDGFTTAKHIRELRPSLPIIAQTAFADPDGERKAKAAGCNDYVTKPIQKSELVSLINKLIQ